MEYIREEKFIYNHKEYEIKIEKKENGYQIKVFQKGNPVNLFPCTINDETTHDYRIEKGESITDQLIDLAKKEIEMKFGKKNSN